MSYSKNVESFSSPVPQQREYDIEREGLGGGIQPYDEDSPNFDQQNQPRRLNDISEREIESE